MRLAALAALAAVTSAACPSPQPHLGTCPTCEADVTVIPDAAPVELVLEDTNPTSTPMDVVADSSDGPPTACPPGTEVPGERLVPVPGELFYAQIGLGGFALGESAIVVGPTGTILLVDVGNDSHDDDVGEVLGDLIGHLAATDGFDHEGAAAIDHVLITHFHADHGDGVEDLLGAFELRGRVLYRGRYDITEAANGGTVGKLCGVLSAYPGAELALCTGPEAAPCDSADWNQTFPSSGCPGLDAGDLEGPGGAGSAFLPLGGEALLRVVAVNGVIGDASFEAEVGPMLTSDSNGENARSLVGVLEHGSFRMLLQGDLTGGGSDTDDVESFYAPRLASVSDLGGLGVDVLHAGHHGRDTSSNETWADALLPRDGRARNVVMGISTAHLGSPHAVVLDTLLGGDRLSGGSAWTTRVAAGGASTAGLVDADGGLVLVRTFDGGDGYFVQAVDGDGVPTATEAFHAVRRCASPVYPPE